MFGTIFLGFRDHALLEPAPGPATAAENPKLGDAPVTLSGGIFGYDSGGGWINIFDSRSFPRCVVLTRCRPQQRYANGFLSSDTAPIGPTVSFIGLDMTQIIDAALGNGRCGFIELRDGWFGSLMWHREEHADIEHARIELRLADCGLEFSYYAASTKPRENPDHPRSVSGKFTIPWEILILRYPRLGCHNPRAKMHRSRASQ